jgi:hypothetical protein
MTSYYSTLKFHQNVSALIEQSSGNYNVRDNTLYKSIQYSILPLKDPCYFTITELDAHSD